MITHVVFFKLKDYSSGNVKMLADALRGMDGQVEALQEIEVGIDNDRSDRAYDVCLITRFASPDDLDAYRVDPVHQKVIGYVRNHCCQTAVVDYQS